MTYVPTANLSPLYTFVQFSGTVSAFGTALTTAFPGMTIQTFTDTQNAGNALVIVNDTTVMSVAVNNYLGYNQGLWQQFPPAKMAGGASSVFTVYP
ncbi:MAG: hypothetical protein JWO67_6484 [Streptosporangiaceae bacterium]|nr:hypothetical protein [Streptosporangiaceae bacterium]